MLYENEDVRVSEEFGLIIDETSDMSRNEKVSLCLSYVVGGESKETFIGFFRNKSTTGPLQQVYNRPFTTSLQQALYNKSTTGPVQQVYNRPFTTSLQQALYNKSTTGPLQQVYNRPFTTSLQQALYNFLEASPKRHAIFEGFGKDEGKSEPLLSTLKSESVTRWSCHWEAVYG